MKTQRQPGEPGLTRFHWFSRVIVALVAWLCIFALALVRVTPQKHVFHAAEIANETVRAPRDVVDTITTEKKRKAARDDVQEKYRQDDTVTVDVMTKLQAAYDAISAVRDAGAAEISKLNGGMASAAYRDSSNALQFTDTFLQDCHAQLPGSFTDEDVRYVILADKKKLENLESKISALIAQSLKNGIMTDLLGAETTRLTGEIVNPLNSFDEGAQRLGMNLVTTYLKANFIYDAEATAEARKQAEDAVKPETYRAQQIIVQEGYLVTEAQMKVLSDLGYLDDNSLHLFTYVGVGLFTGLMLLVLWLYLLMFKQEVFANFRRMLLLHLVLVLTVALTALTRTLHEYFLLTTMGTLLIAVLVNHRLALTINGVLALLAGMLAGSESTGSFSTAALPAVAAAMSGGVLAVYVVRQAPQRTTLMLAGLASGLVQAGVIAAVCMMSATDWQTTLKDCGYAAAGGVISAMLCLGTLPLWEQLFKVVTPMRLLELANPNHPLLKRLLMEAPGTYHHSIVVGNLAEAAAEAIGANALLTRSAAYYHDIGKLQRPYFFAENQLGGENPHDSITPELSKRILTSHPRDGLALAIKHNLPQAVQDVIMEHHGTTPVMYFYHKAVKESDTQVQLDDYRYTGPKPRTREAALIMLADSVEAGARALSDHSPEKLDEFVQHIVNIKLEDGQFDDCDLTLRDLGTITNEFRKVLVGIFHERVAYPAIEPPTKKASAQW